MAKELYKVEKNEMGMDKKDAAEVEVDKELGKEK